jgi:hypothetical protein
MMKFIRFVCELVGICGAAAILAGCGAFFGSAQGDVAPVNAQAMHGFSRIPPGTSNGDLIYVASAFEPDVTTSFYTYPGLQYVGSIAGGTGLCSDKLGNVYVVYDGGWTEYAHGGTTPIQSYSNSQYNFLHCSVDAVTGNLAVSIQNAGVAVFTNASSAPLIYTGPFGDAVYCAYDRAGDLFIFGSADGGSSSEPQLQELAFSESTLIPISLPRKIRDAEQLQWDGQHIAIAQARGPAVYRLKILHGNVGKIVLSSRFHGIGHDQIEQFWISGTTIVFPFDVKGSSGDDIGVWTYPNGGQPIATFRGPSPTFNQAVTISVGSSN